MQDAFFQDMFNLGGINNSRNNGYIQVSSAGKGTKRDRKGCKKGKIEAIMKNNHVSSKNRVRLTSGSSVKKTKPNHNLSNHILNSGTVIKSELHDNDDPYTFTEPEPQVLSLYQGPNNLTLNRKVVPLLSHKPNQVIANKSNLNMVCLEKGDGDAGKVKTFNERIHPLGGLPVRPLGTKSNEGSSKTMNRLQADIARSKVIVKRHKTVSSRSGWKESEIKTEPKISESYSPSFAKVSIPANRMHRQSTWQRERKLRHEALQRIEQAQQDNWEMKHDLFPLGLELSDSEEDGDVEEEEDNRGVFQRHWFMGCVWENGEDRGGRESRLAQVSGELRRRVRQIWQGVSRRGEPESRLVQAVVDASRRQPSESALLLNPRLRVTPKQSRSRISMLTPRKCCLENICNRVALPCTRHCAQHIMYNVDQLLFEHCTAKFADNMQCCAPVFDITHELPLCHDHARKCDNYDKLYIENKPKKPSRKKPKPSALTRSTKRGKKKKKPRSSPSSSLSQNTPLSDAEIIVKTEPVLPVDEVSPCLGVEHMMIQSSPGSHHPSEVFLTDAASMSQVEIQVEDAVEEVSEEVLAIASLDPAELASQASRLLEEHDLTNMLNQIPFSDLFTEDKNGQYVPTREETEELERALEAVDKDVRKLERMTRALPLSMPLALDSISLLDDVAGVYPSYQNGYTSSQPIQAQPDLRHS